MKKTLPTIEQVSAVLSYEPDTGLFRWKKDRARTAKAGQIAGWINQDGYIRIETLGVAMMAHRLAWFMVHGVWPKDELDHINCNRADNRLCNLREATRTDNNRNARRPARNTSGFKGVSFHKRIGKWQAAIHHGKTMSLGYYETPEEAHQAYVEAVHRFRGEFARAA